MLFLCEVAQLGPTLCNNMDYSLPGSAVPEIFQARVLEWGAFAFSDSLPRHVLSSKAAISHTVLFHFNVNELKIK